MINGGNVCVTGRSDLVLRRGAIGNLPFFLPDTEALSFSCITSYTEELFDNPVAFS